MFQSFETTSDPASVAPRVAALREMLTEHGLNGFLVPHADEHQNEYLPPNAERLAYISGFTGSAGFAIVLEETAAIFVDGRYTLQVQEQTDLDIFSPLSLIDLPPHKWLEKNTSDDMTIGYDPALHTIGGLKALTKAAEASGCALKPVETNLIDQIWEDQPPRRVEPVRIHPIQFAGEEAKDKISQLAAGLRDKNRTHALISDPTSICWLFNIRGQDVAHTPLMLAHCLLRAEGRPMLFLERSRLNIETAAYLTELSDLVEPSQLPASLRSELNENSVVQLDPNQSSAMLADLVAGADAKFVEARDPVVLPRAIKNQVEINGSRAAHIRDGAAICAFLCWLDQQEPSSRTEIELAHKLESCRVSAGEKAQMPLKDISFDTISGAGPNGAIVHYRVTTKSSRTLQEGELYLVDSGGQYEDGTTDITRTVPVGAVGADERRAYTLVLKGHIAIALARFPEKTRGVDLDVLARNALWRSGMDYAHGTGHGIGAFLSVHEGPQSLSKRGMEPLLPGMILSNEPGYYREGKFGIRLENLILVREATDITGGDLPMLGFETLSFVPFDQRLIDPDLLTPDELHWLNAYHGHTRNLLSDHVDEDVRAWLEAATTPISSELPAASA